MKRLYYKDDDGNFAPLDVKSIDISKWENGFVFVKTGGDVTDPEKIAKAFSSIQEFFSTTFFVANADMDIMSMGTEQEIKDRVLNGESIKSIFSNMSPDECKKCGHLGKVSGSSCVCPNCGNVIWGC